MAMVSMHIQNMQAKYVTNPAENWKKSGGIIALMDEACMFPKSTHETFAQKMYQTYKTHKRFSKTKLARTEFTINHYAVDVTYLADLFLDKNKDFAVPKHQALLNATPCAFVASLFPPLPEESSRSSKFSSVGTCFKASVCAAGDSASYCRAVYFGDEVVIVATYHTAKCKAKRGGFKDSHPGDFLAPVLKALIDKTGINPNEVGDIVVETVPVRTVNRQCYPGLQAVADVAATIKAGFYDIGIGAGLESMTANPMAWEGFVNPKVEIFK